MIELNFRPEKKDLRLFAVLLIPFGLVVGYLIWHYASWELGAWIIGGVLSCMGVLGLIAPQAISWFFVGWMILAFPIGWTISHVVMAIVFYGLFFPFGAIARCFGYDPLQMRSEDKESYWHSLDPVENKQQYFRQF